MLFVRVGPDGLVGQQVLNLDEEGGLFVVMVRGHELVPCAAVADKGGAIGGGDVRGLAVDGVEAAENGIVQEAHVGGSRGEEIGLSC